MAILIFSIRCNTNKKNPNKHRTKYCQNYHCFYDDKRNFSRGFVHNPTVVVGNRAFNAEVLLGNRNQMSNSATGAKRLMPKPCPKRHGVAFEGHAPYGMEYAARRNTRPLSCQSGPLFKKYPNTPSMPRRSIATLRSLLPACVDKGPKHERPVVLNRKCPAVIITVCFSAVRIRQRVIIFKAITTFGTG